MNPNLERKKHTWWDALSDDWKKIFVYDYLQTTTEDINDIVWRYKEITGSNEDGTLTGFVNTDLILHNLRTPTVLISMHVRNATELFDFSGDMSIEFSSHGSKFKIYWDFYPKSTSGVRELKLKSFERVTSSYCTCQSYSGTLAS
jgi:hypothetical protein